MSNQSLCLPKTTGRSRLVRCVYLNAFFTESSFAVSLQALTQLDVCGKVVVADTFEEIVNDPEKDVLIEFYAPWCGHCKKLEPKYTELAEQVSFTWHVRTSLWLLSDFFWSCFSVFCGPVWLIAVQLSQYSNRQDGCDCQRCPSGLWRTRACIHILSSLIIKSFILILVSIVNVLLFFHSFPTIYFAAAGRKQEPKRYEVAFLSAMTMFLMIHCGYHVHIFVIMNMNSLYFHSGSPWSEGFHQLPEAWGVQTSCPKWSQGRAVKRNCCSWRMEKIILLLFSHTYQIELIDRSL